MRGSLRRAAALARTVLARGLLDLVRDFPTAAEYWRRVLGALSFGAGGGDPEGAFASRALEQAFPGTLGTVVDLEGYGFDYGEMPVEELVLLCRLARSLRPEVIFEIGTFQGGTTLQLALNTKALVYTLDLPPPEHADHTAAAVRDPSLDVYPEEVGIRFRGSPCETRIHQLFGNSSTFDFSPYHGTADLVFVDGCHHRDAVASDSRQAQALLRQGGVIVWHDYAPYAPGVVAALNDLSTSLRLVHIKGTTLVVARPGGK